MIERFEEHLRGAEQGTRIVTVSLGGAGGSVSCGHEAAATLTKVVTVAVKDSVALTRARFEAGVRRGTLPFGRASAGAAGAPPSRGLGPLMSRMAAAAACEVPLDPSCRPDLDMHFDCMSMGHPADMAALKAGRMMTQASSVALRVARRPFAKGASRWAFKAKDLSTKQQLVLKADLTRAAEPLPQQRAVSMIEMETQTVAGYLAMQFNAKMRTVAPSAYKLQFLQTSVLVSRKAATGPASAHPMRVQAWWRTIFMRSLMST